MNNNMEGLKEKRELRMANEAKFEDYVYHPSLLPGAFAFPYLLPPAGSTGVSHLRLLIPDTIVVTEDANDELTTWWYYTDDSGRVRGTSDFTTNAVINKIGNNTFDGALAVVNKTPCVIRVGKKVRKCPGNEISLMTTRQLAATPELPGRPPGKGGADALNRVKGGPPGDGTAPGALSPPYILQRFVKPSGPRASLLRAELKSDRKLRVFTISATARFEELILGLDRKEDKHASLANWKPKRTETDFFTASPRGVALGDATITSRIKRQAGTVDLLSSAKTDTNGQVRDGVPDIADMMWEWLQLRLRRALQSLVLDFVRDDTGHLWLLQVKGFQFRCSDPSRPLGRALEMPPLLRPGGVPPRALPPMAKTPLRSTETFTVLCKCCLVGIATDEATYHLSQQMVTWLAMHIRSRLAPEKRPTFVTRITTRVLTDHHKRERSRIGRYKDDGGVTHPILGSSLLLGDKAAGGGSHGAGSRDSFRTTVAVCGICFQLYQAETKLRQVTDQLAHVAGACHSAPPDDDPKWATRPRTVEDGEQAYEGRYLTWSATFGERRARAILRILAAAKRNDSNAEVVARSDLERHLSARATTINKQQHEMLNRLLRVDSGFLQPNSRTLGNFANSFAFKSKSFKGGKRISSSATKAKASWRIANKAVKGKFLAELFTKKKTNEDKVTVKGRHFDFTKDQSEMAPSNTKEKESEGIGTELIESDLTLCRLLIAIHEIVDLPAYLTPHVTTIRLSYSLFDRRHQINVKVDGKRLKDPKAVLGDITFTDMESVLKEEASKGSNVTPMSGTFQAMIEAKRREKKLGEICLNRQHVFQFLAPHTGVDSEVQGGGEVHDKEEKQAVNEHWTGKNCGGLYDEEGAAVGGAGGGIIGAASRKHQLSGLAEFLRSKSSIEMNVELETNEEGIEAAILAANHQDKPIHRETAAEIWAKAMTQPKADKIYVLRGKCTLHFSQLSADGHVRQIEPRVLCALRIPMLPSTDPEASTLIAVLLRFSICLSRVRSPIDKETLPDPLIYYHGVYVPLEAQEWRPCDPFPAAWLRGLALGQQSPVYKRPVSPILTFQTTQTKPINLVSNHHPNNPSSRSDTGADEDADSETWSDLGEKDGYSEEDEENFIP